MATITKQQADQVNASLAGLNTGISALNKARGWNLPAIGGQLSPTATTPPATTATVPTVNRTPGLLQKSQEAAILSEEQKRGFQREADAYAGERRQARIDAINQAFAPQVQRAEEEGARQMSRVAAVNFNKGLVGSGVDTTRTGEQKQANEAVLRGIEDQKAIMINDAFTAADALALERAKQLTDEARYSAQEKADLYAKQSESALETLKMFGQTGTSWEDIKMADPKTYNTLKDVSGMSDFEIQNYLTANTPGAKILKTEVTSDGTVVNVIQKADGSIDVQRNATDIGGGEEFKLIDGVGYGLKKDASGNLSARKLTEKTSGGAGGLTPYQQFSATQSIAKDTQARTEQAREMARQSQLIQQSYNNIIGGGDRSLNTQAIITSFNKILDPSSVVRESEYDRTSAGQSLIARLEGKVQNIAAGGAGVTPATLKEAADIADEYLKGAKKSIEKQNERARQMATQFGLNPDFVTSTGQIGDSGTLRSPDGLYEVSTSDLTPAELAEAKATGWQ